MPSNVKGIVYGAIAGVVLGAALVHWGVPAAQACDPKKEQCENHTNLQKAADLYWATAKDRPKNCRVVALDVATRGTSNPSLETVKVDMVCGNALRTLEREERDAAKAAEKKT